MSAPLGAFCVGKCPMNDDTPLMDQLGWNDDGARRWSQYPKPIKVPNRDVIRNVIDHPSDEIFRSMADDY